MHLFISIIASLLLLACSAKQEEPIETKEYFTSRVNEQGVNQFAFGLAWSPDAVPQNNKPDAEQGRRSLERGERTRAFAVPAMGRELDKQSKLELEDQAARTLQSYLDNRHLCKNGHKIDQVVWEVGRIRLMGSCL